jgi:asparagine synthase (glutamine-hydrolysing)
VSDQKINTFSIAIDEGKYDESKYARAVARHLKTSHHQFNVRGKEVLEVVNDLLPTYDEPFADSSSFPTMLLSRLAKQQVTVALSGDGGDELFMGYGTHVWADRMDHPFVRTLRWPIHLASKMMSNRYQRAGEVFAYPVEDRRISHIFSAEQYYFNENELKENISQLPFNFETLNRTNPLSRPCTKAEAQSIWDFNYYLGDELLVKLDRASMRYSLETRIPLLDYRIVEFAYNLHQDLKMKNGTMKYLMKEVLYDYVPKHLFDRPKWGFTIPLGKWLKTDLIYLLDKYTDRKIIEKYNYVKYDNVKELKRQYLDGKDSRANRLWLIIILHWWLEENG